MNNGITSSWKLTGRAAAASFTLTGILIDLPSYWTKSAVEPSATG